MSTAMRLSQAWPSQPAAPFAARTKAGDTVETVGLSALIIIVVEPPDAPTALRTISTLVSRP